MRSIRRRTTLLAAAALLAALARAETTPSVSTSTASAEEEPQYVYTAAARDPFVPLAGASVTSDTGFAPDKETGAFNPSNVELKGILRSRTGRWAVLMGNTGDRYIVENGKIHDAKRKPVEGFVGIIKEKTLVLIGPNNQVTELKMKRDQDKEKDEKGKAKGL